MKIVSLRDNVTGDENIHVMVTNKDYKTLNYLKTCGGFLRFNMELYSDEKGVKHKTDKNILLPFLHNVFANKKLIDSYFN